jgi:inorganic pyrophosphatase
MQVIMDNREFWQVLDRLVGECELVIDRPHGSAHPRYPEVYYPLDYGYLAGTRAGDGDGIDVWVGSRPEQRVSSIICTVDSLQRDAEIKILLGCTPQEVQLALAAHNSGQQRGILIERDGEGGDLG